ncbi:TIGR01620 family protein [Devosia sp. ZB163]|uniref:YcjF family protein n=1 Tax=Devosia sp. ZB163 TaxID=3025938 RepID=UPI0023601AFC|nr:TIGR01620 family protein [Devosia sp. ZB163]MDC9824163.1 TIGR01620 family protein [Devosia sp. ZB163]
MKPPFARPVGPEAEQQDDTRRPRAFQPTQAIALPEEIELLTDVDVPLDEAVEPPRLMGWFGRLLWTTGGILVSLALGLAAERLISDLFATQPWLGWVGLAVLAAFLVALVGIIAREAASLMRLRALDRLRHQAIATLASDRGKDGAAITRELLDIYARRPDLARGREQLETDARHIFDGAEHVRLGERLLMAPLDARARALTAASARRVALVTTVSPRALIDIAFVIFESVRLGGDIARLYGARPGLMGTWRLLGAILAHLAVTGGLVLTDGVVEQLVGQGLAAKLSARLGEGVVNGLMTVRVGIAAMRVVRPLPFEVAKQPMVKDFIPELANVLGEKKVTP